MSGFAALEAGSPDRLGAHADAHGVNFAVYSPSGERVELCLFDTVGAAPLARLALPARTGDIWHGYLPGARCGLVYGYRVHGPHAPARGHRFNPNKLLLDPHARALVGSFEWNDAVLGYDARDPLGDDSFDTRDSAPFVPKCRVVRPIQRPNRPRRPAVPWPDTVVYELHARGFTRLHPEVPPALRGTVRALAEPAVVDHLRRLGVTTLELLPVAEFIDERALAARGLRNFWGYNPLAFFAAHRAYLASDDAAEFADVVDRLHEAGIEVVLDVVFNHTAEGDALGPTLSFRGLDNAAYYRLDVDDPRRYRDDSGCGNTLDLANPAVVALVRDALRYWALEIGVDGFRIDLAAALSRDARGRFDAGAPLWRALRDDPELATLKLIVEPWDVGEHHLGEFPAPLAEWNDRFRDTVRRFWRGDAGIVADLATRFAGSSDVFAPGGRAPCSGINFVTAHDGFTLADLVAYREKHNEANGEDNRDGAADNFSSNGGCEGPTDDPLVLERRAHRLRAMLATLLLSRGVPMLLAGDELSRTQHGNNNAYCQDNPIGWLDWSALGDATRDHVDFVQRLTAMRRRLAPLRDDSFPTGRPNARTGRKDIAWLREDGFEMEHGDWHDTSRRALGILAVGHAGEETGDCLYVALNGGDTELAMRLPALDDDWLCVLDSADDATASSLYAAESIAVVGASSLRVFVPRATAGLGVPKPLSEAAERAGISSAYEDIGGRRRLVPEQTLVRLLASLGRESMPAKAEAGPRVVAPAACWLPPCLRDGSRRWVLSAQVYGLRSARSWGIGDFDDIGRLAELAASIGASGLMLSPLHAPRLSMPERASPYAPSSRLALNPLTISIAAADEDDPSPRLRQFLERDDVRATLARLAETPYVDYSAVARLKLEAIALLHLDFRERHLDGATTRGEAFRRFQANERASVCPYAIFEALDAHFTTTRSAWPDVLHRADAAAVDSFAREHAVDVERHEFAQWIARRQWDRATARAREAGMEIGLVNDLALGAAADGAEAWQWPDLVVADAELGAPPDAFARSGQRWGLPPWNPHRLVEHGLEPYAELLRASMRGAGAIRIDHVMGLMRQFWIPSGSTPDRGAYVRFPFDELLAALAQESGRARCAVIGEDLGNVPHGFRGRMAEAGMLGYRVVYFERDALGAMTAPDRYAPLSVAAITTHDLPTLAGFWTGADLDERAPEGSPVPSDIEALRAERGDRRDALARALRSYGCADDADSFVDAAHRFLAATSSGLAAVQLEDVVRMPRQANRPGTADAAPNWRQRLPVTLEALADDRRFTALAGIFAARARADTQPPPR